MAVVLYPPELNQVWMVQGFQAQRADRRVAAQPTRGRPFYRKGSSATGGRPISATTREPVGNVPRFWRFFDEELRGGVLPFKVRDQQIDGTELADQAGNPILDQAGRPLLIGAFWVCRFVNPPDEGQPVGDLSWQISFSLLVFN